jgi:hypothetical protein
MDGLDDDDWAILSSGMIPEIRTVADVPMAVAYANTHPAARWYVQKRCAVLGQDFAWRT